MPVSNFGTRRAPARVAALQHRQAPVGALPTRRPITPPRVAPQQNGRGRSR